MMKEIRKDLDSAISDLSPTNRAVFVLRHVEGLSTEETTEILGISIPAVKSRLHRTRLVLQEKLNGRWRTIDSSEKNADIISPEITETGVITATLQTNRVRGYMAFITVEAKKDGKVVARGKAEVVVTPPPVWDDYETFTWLGDGLTFIFDQEAQLMRDFGLTGNSGSAGNAKRTKKLFRENMRVHPIGFAAGMHVRNFSESVKAYGNTKEASKTH